jgi:hypothetical protein
MAVHMAERFKYPAVQAEITRLVRSEPKAVIGVAEALHFLLGDKLEAASRPALKVSSRHVDCAGIPADYISGYPFGRLFLLSPRWSSSSRDTATIRSFSNTPCACWSSTLSI